MEVEEYDCGCKIRFHPLSPSEVGDEFPRRPPVIPGYTPCPKHRTLERFLPATQGSSRSAPTCDSPTSEPKEQTSPSIAWNRVDK